MDWKKIGIVAGVILIIFYLITQPIQSADMVHSILNTLKEGAESLITFVKEVFNG